MGLVNKAEGNVYWDSTDITVMKTKDIVGAGLILCPEGRRIFPDLTVEETSRRVHICARIRTVSQRTEHGSTAFSHVCRKEPGSWERRSPGGEQQMLAVGRALMSRPKLLMLDEPSLGLAPLIIKDIFTIIQQIKDAA